MEGGLLYCSFSFWGKDYYTANFFPCRKTTILPVFREGREDYYGGEAAIQKQYFKESLFAFIVDFLKNTNILGSDLLF